MRFSLNTPLRLLNSPTRRYYSSQTNMSIQHIVLFKFKAGVDAAEAKSFEGEVQKAVKATGLASNIKTGACARPGALTKPLPRSGVSGPYSPLRGLHGPPPLLSMILSRRASFRHPRRSGIQRSPPC
jgi:hypothetical protein